MSRKQKKQHTQRHSLGNTKHHSRHSHTIRLDIPPEQLFENGDMQGVVDLLQPHIKKHPADDEKRRLLGWSLYNLDKYKDAAETLLLLADKTSADLLAIGTSYYLLNEKDQAITWLKASVEQEEGAWAFYMLARAHLLKSGNDEDDDDWTWKPDPHTDQHVVDALQRARSLPNCPVEGYLLLNERLWLLACYKELDDDKPGARDNAKDIAQAQCKQVIEEAFALYPDHAKVRLEYGEDLIEQGKYETALMVLSPLMIQDTPLDTYQAEKAIALGIAAALGARLYEKALQYLELLPPSSWEEKTYQPSLLKLKGDIFLLQGDFDAARKCYEQQIQINSMVNQFIGLFSIAWTWLQQNEWEQARSWAGQAAKRWFDEFDLLTRCEAIECPPYISIAGVFVGEDLTQCVKQVSHKLLSEDSSLDSILKGQLSYLLYKVESEHLKEPEKQIQSLHQCTQWFSHPFIDSDLAELFFTVGNMPQALECYLDYCIAAFTIYSEEFYEDFEFYSRHVETVTNEDTMRAMHAVAFQKLQTCQDASLIEDVFHPFFDEFWRQLLQKGGLKQELVDVTKILIDASDEVNNTWFYYAWGLSKLGKNEEAEQAYRHFLAHFPDDADALHNLSLLLEKKGLLQEALEVSERAASLSPTVDNIVNHYHRLQRMYKEQLAQERAHSWSLLSDNQKRLLCLLELYPAAHWSELAIHLKNDERQLRQLQEDWEGLVDQKAIVSGEENARMQANTLLLPAICEDGFRHWLVSELARVQVRKKKDIWVPQAAELGDEHLTNLTPTQRDLLHKALMRQIEQVSSAGLEQVHLLFYRRIWKNLLLQWKMHAELVDLCHVFLTRLSVMSREDLWECAYYATDLTSPQYPALAETLYKQYLEQGEGRAAYHNLAVIHFRRKQYQDALQMIDQALRVDPSSTISLQFKETITQAIRAEEEQRQRFESEQRRQREQREQYLKDLEQKIAAHLGEVDYYKQRILQAVKDARYAPSKRSLAQQLRMEDWAFDGHWRKLVSWGMLLEEGKRAVELHPLVHSYLEQGWPVPLASSMKTVVINPAAGSLTKPVFGSKQEYKLYTVLLEIFHGQLVFPNMALQAIFPYVKMKEVLTKEEFSYYMVASVDICITRTTSYFPLVAFEVDGPHHEQEERQRKDALKNTIFEKGGLGLIRLQIGHQPLSTKDLWEDAREKINQALYLWRSDPTRKGWVEDVEAELGMSRFGREMTEHEEPTFQSKEKDQDGEEIQA